MVGQVTFRITDPWEEIVADCKVRGLLVPSQVTDHIKPHNGDLELFWDEANWQGLCKPCHDSKTRNDEHEQKSGRIRLSKGCDASGVPLDKRHFWHEKG